MSDESLTRLADAAGIASKWRDFRGGWHDVAPDTLRAVLGAMGIPAKADGEIRDGLERVSAEARELPSLITATVDAPLNLPAGAVVEMEGGGTLAGDHARRIGRPGYHTLIAGSRHVTLAVAPRRCHDMPSPRDGVRPWGIATQLYSLRRRGDGGIGDFGALRAFVTAAGRHGADGVAISPVHAQFSADPERFSPYAPSSRVMLNVLHTEGNPDSDLERQDLVDWPNASRARLASFRQTFEAEGDVEAFTSFRTNMGSALERHARFEALHAVFFGGDLARWHWNTWPPEFRNPESAAVETFARQHARDVAFHAWLQFRADRGLADAQAAARDAGMRIGLISDLAVGADSGGSHAWSRQDEMMIGLSIGAPPDLLNTKGQDWGISAFLPLGLRRHGYAAFIEMLRAALRHAGGVRIDHAMGLARLWVVPDGADAAHGAYLNFPVDDLLRLIALESHRHGAIVLGEDLGTLPDGYHDRLIETGVLGMRVLWFEREDESRFHAPGQWSSLAAAMTTTHDLPTVAGWWHGRDIDWRERMGWLPDSAAERTARARDRGLLWQEMRDSGAAQGEQPPERDTWPAVRAALSHVSRSACEFALLPLEDVLARVEQPNLPGTTNEHPNWCRRLPGDAADLLDSPEVIERLDTVKASRAV